MKKLLPFLLLHVLFLGTGMQMTAQNRKPITLEDIFLKNVFQQDRINGFRSMKNGRFFSEIRDQKLLKIRFEDGQTEEEILDLGSLQTGGKKMDVEEYAFNATEDKILLFTSSESIYRRSTKYVVYCYDLKSKILKQINEDPVLHATFSPDGEHVAYVYNNNMWLCDISSMEQVQVSNDGDFNTINGNCDWVYEEEFEFSRAYEWAPDGSYLAYYRFDQQEVPEYQFDLYESLYPEHYRYKYPKAGEANSKVGIFIYHLESGRTVEAKFEQENEFYIPRLKMDPFNNQPVVYVMNRRQNELKLLEVNPKNGQTQMIYEQKDAAYIELNDQIRFLKRRHAMVIAHSGNGYNHLYLYDLEANTSSFITRGDWEVTALYDVDEERNVLYYTSTEFSPLERNLFSIRLNGEDKVCLTPDKGWHENEFSNGFEFFLDKYSYRNVPPVFSIKNRNGNLVRVIKENAGLREKMKQYAWSELTFLDVDNAAGIPLHGYMIKPSDFNPSTKYPLLMFQYSGPGSQQVMNQFGPQNFWWHQYLAQKGYIIVCFDGTGTGFRGDAFRKKTYQQLGKFESDDQIFLARYFAKQPFIDASRIGIWGWSYGGFMSSTCIMKGSDVFKAAIAVAPVTNWRYYDNIYTERYMRLPSENADGYDSNSPVNMVDQLKGKFLLIHGSADDNVHLQNSMMLVNAMIKANKEFDSEYYPNKNHGISGGNTRYHLFKRMTRFLEENL